MKRYTLTESRLRSMIREAVKSILNETIAGGSSISGSSFNPEGKITRNQGGGYGADSTDKAIEWLNAQDRNDPNREKRQQLDYYINYFLKQGWGRSAAVRKAEQYLGIW